MVGDLKRVEEMCQRLKLHLGRCSRPAKLQAGKPRIDWRFLPLIARDGVACQIHRHHVDAGLR